MIKRTALVFFIVLLLSALVFGYDRRIQITARYSITQGIDSNYAWGFGLQSFWLSNNLAFPVADFGFTKLDKESYIYKSKDP